jgi:hypothetical protein
MGDLGDGGEAVPDDGVAGDFEERLEGRREATISGREGGLAEREGVPWVDLGKGVESGCLWRDHRPGEGVNEEISLVCVCVER